MGQDVARTVFTRRDRQRYRSKVHSCLDALATMLGDGVFAADTEPMTGLEVELNLVNHELEPAMCGDEVLAGVNRPEFQSELGRWNVELNLPPRPLAGEQSLHLERQLLELLAATETQARRSQAHSLAIGILPTLREPHLVYDRLSPDTRYEALNEQMVAARGEPFRLDIEGLGLGEADAERLVMDFDSIAPEAACTSMQLHLQVAPEEFAAHWNAAQCLAGVQLAVGANSPFLLGNRLWAETRVPLFLQATDVRAVELRNQGVRPRVWFGERWIGSIFELFTENVRYFPGLLPLAEDEDPQAELEAGRFPALPELRLHNGTIWRWNRPIYDMAGGVPHVRVENRVLPAGPTAVDMVANALFFYGLLRVLAEQEQPLWDRLPFEAAEENFLAGARAGMAGPLYWPGLGWVQPDQLILHELLPMAADGLSRWGVADSVAARSLEVIERRCVRRCTGSSWQVQVVDAFERRGFDRSAAIRQMLGRYLELTASNQPVHTWPTP